MLADQTTQRRIVCQGNNKLWR